MACLPKYFIAAVVLLPLQLLAAETEKLSDPCAPIEWKGDTPWKNPLSSNMIYIQLDDIITQVFSNAVSIRAADAMVRAAQKEVSIQRSAYWPSLSASTSWNQNLDGLGHRLPSDLYSASLNATWVLFDGFQRELSVIKSAHERNATIYAEQETRRNLHKIISSVWFATLLAQERMDASQKDILFNQSLLELAIKQYKAGVARRSDVLNFKIKLMEDVNTYFSQRLLFDSNLTILEKLLQVHGVLSADTHRLVDPYPDLIAVQGMDLEAEISKAENSRSDVLQKLEMIKAARAEVRLQRGTRLPSVTFLGSYASGSQSSYDLRIPDEAYSFLGVALSWNFFSGFSSHHEVIKAKEELLIAEIALESHNLELRAEFTQLDKNLNNAMHLYQNSILRKEAAFEDRKLVTELYESDLVAITRLNEVQKDAVHATEYFIKSRILVGAAWENTLIATGNFRMEAPLQALPLSGPTLDDASSLDIPPSFNEDKQP